MIEGQPQHAAMALLMMLGAFALLDPGGKPLLGLTGAGWARLSILLAVLHQVVVAAGFRLQLHRNALTRLWGRHDMRNWAIVFLPLLLARPVTAILTGWADDAPPTAWRLPELLLGLALLIPSLWALWSTVVHFTLPRALGGDHFRDDIAALPMVRRGAFAATPNAMYGLAFLGLWAIALLFGSWNALVVALFQHAYIWVHMYCTEAPDMGWIHGDRLERA